MDHDKLFARRRLIVAMDACTIALSMVLAGVTHVLLRRQFDVFKDPPAVEQYLLIAALTVPLMLSLVAILGLHRQFERRFDPRLVAWDLMKLHGASLVGIALIVFLTQVPLNRSVVALFLIFTFVLMLSARLMLDRRRRRSHADGRGRAHLLLIGRDPALVALVVDSARNEDFAPEFVGLLECGPSCDANRAVSGVPVLGTVDDLAHVLHHNTVDEVVIATRSLDAARFAQVLDACDDLGTPMRQLVLPDFHDGRRLGLERQFGLPFVTLVRTERSTEALAIKRAIDLLGSSCAILLLSPVMLLISLLILATMGRPILFSQDRTGYHGRRFRMHKFRSMVADAEQRKSAMEALNEMGGPVFKASADPRITPLGRILRKYSLDELPQFFNVFVGSMSLVGPRPLPVAEQQQISGPMRRRLSMKPGITGLWQVSGRSNLSFEEWMQMDLEYLDNWSNLQDLRVLLLTVPAVVAGRGAS